MADPVNFRGSNSVLKGPSGRDDVRDLPTFRNGVCCVSAWELTEEEMASVMETRTVFVSVLSGQTQPPVYVGDRHSVNQLAMAYGSGFTQVDEEEKMEEQPVKAVPDVPFNGLTPAQAERLAMLAEECSEVAQAVTKILRHGYDSHHPNGGPNNRDHLASEVMDVHAVLFGMIDAGDLGVVPANMAPFRWRDKLEYTHHQGE